MWIVGAVVLFDLIFVPIVIRAIIQSNWKPLEKKFPPQALGEDSVRKDFQSYRIGVFNLGYSVHTTADDMHLHMEPAKVLRWLGMGPVSIPWDAMLAKRTRGKSWAEVKIGSHSLWGPRWALEMAFVDTEETEPRA